jgi:hypothetical protein
MFLSRPIISYLKGEAEATAFLPPEMYDYFLTVLVYTFVDELNLADSYLFMLKDQLRHWSFVKHSGYEIFLVKLIEKLR